MNVDNCSSFTTVMVNCNLIGLKAAQIAATISFLGVSEDVSGRLTY